jgi:hypothetical protein
MGLKAEISDIIDELDNFHFELLGNISELNKEQYFPNFVTSKNGLQRHFTRKAMTLLRSISDTIFDNEDKISRIIERNEFEKVVKQCVADFHAEGKYEKHDSENLMPGLVEYIKSQAYIRANKYTHYFPAWTLGMERINEFSIGPVTFMTREQWIESVDIPDHVKENFLGQKEANYRWKDILLNGLQKWQDEVSLDGFAGYIHDSISKCPSILKITLVGYEKNLSRKHAEMICRSALDAVSLIFGGREFFLQQALQNERLPPTSSNSLIETDGYLWMPGFSLSPRIPHISPARASEELQKIPVILSALESILEALSNPKSHKYPGLANRWAISLDWFGEGNREKSDSIALAKIATSLDVLACGGKLNGILEMLENLLDIDRGKQVISGKSPKTFKKLIENIYDDGRSKILHGTYSDRLESYSDLRAHAAHIARMALIESAARLKNYQGNNTDTAFRKMPPVTQVA